jgi:hypothetical protein
MALVVVWTNGLAAQQTLTRDKGDRFSGALT